jgi:cytochrome c oxidase subunit 2
MPVVAQAGYFYPADQMPVHVLPTTPIPAGLTFDDNVLAQGDAARGAALLQNPVSPAGCYACHTMTGVQMMVGQTGPNLTHVGSRNTIAAGLFPNDAKHLALWIKNARLMKPGIVMPTLGAGQIDPQTKQVGVMAKLTDAQIADIVAYLRLLK